MKNVRRKPGKKIKLFDLSIGKKEEQALIKTLRSHYWASGAGGTIVKKYEKCI